MRRRDFLQAGWDERRGRRCGSRRRLLVVQHDDDPWREHLEHPCSLDDEHDDAADTDRRGLERARPPPRRPPGAAVLAGRDRRAVLQPGVRRRPPRRHRVLRLHRRRPRFDCLRPPVPRCRSRFAPAATATAGGRLVPAS